MLSHGHRKGRECYPGKTDMFPYAPFEHTLGQVDDPALSYPGETGQLSDGPSPDCGLIPGCHAPLREVAPRCVVPVRA